MVLLCCCVCVFVCCLSCLTMHGELVLTQNGIMFVLRLLAVVCGWYHCVVRYCLTLCLTFIQSSLVVLGLRALCL